MLLKRRKTFDCPFASLSTSLVCVLVCAGPPRREGQQRRNGQQWLRSPIHVQGIYPLVENTHTKTIYYTIGGHPLLLPYNLKLFNFLLLLMMMVMMMTNALITLCFGLKGY